MLKCGSSQLMASGGVLGGERDSVIFEGPATGSLTMIQCIWSAQIGFGIFFFILWGGHKSGKIDMGRMGCECDRGLLYEIPK